MSLSQSDVARLAQLARLQLDAAEAARSLAELNAVFELIAQLREVDTTNVAPMTHAAGGRSSDGAGLRRRADEVGASNAQRADYQAVAPAVQDGLYLVPRVIE